MVEEIRRATWALAVLGSLVLSGCRTEPARAPVPTSTPATTGHATESLGSAEPNVDGQATWMQPYSPTMSWGTPHRIGSSDANASSVAPGRGRHIDLDVRDADLQDVCRLLADVGRVSIVVSDDGSERVTLKMKGVPWDQALELIVRTKGLRMHREGDVIIVSR